MAAGVLQPLASAFVHMTRLDEALPEYILLRTCSLGLFRREASPLYVFKPRRTGRSLFVRASGFDQDTVTVHGSDTENALEIEYGERCCISQSNVTTIAV